MTQMYLSQKKKKEMTEKGIEEGEEEQANKALDDADKALDRFINAANDSHHGYLIAEAKEIKDHIGMAIKKENTGK